MKLSEVASDSCTDETSYGAVSGEKRGSMYANKVLWLFGLFLLK